MAKIVEEAILVKFSRIVREGDAVALTADTKMLLAEAVPALIEEIINDKSVIVEIIEIAGDGDR